MRRGVFGVCTLSAGLVSASCDSSLATPKIQDDTRSFTGTDSDTFRPVTKPSTPFWLRSKRWPESESGPVHLRRTSQELPSHVEVVIVGAGLSGAGCVHRLAALGVPSLLLDARGISGGASGRNGGFLGGVTTFRKTMHMLLREDWRHVWQTMTQEIATVGFIHRFVQEHNVDADLDRDVDGIKFFATEEEFTKAVGWYRFIPRALLRVFGVHIMEHEEMRTQLNLLPSELDPLNSWGCIRLRRKYDTICIARFVVAVVDAAIKMGASVHTHTNVRTVESVKGGFLVDTDRGDVHCNKVVIATNGYTGSLVPALADKIRPIRNHVLVTTPAPSLARDGSRCGVSHGDDFHYFIQRKDGRIVLGGFRDEEPDFGVDTADDGSDDPAARTAIRDFLWQHFYMGDASVEQEWTGIIGWSCDDAPWVGQMPGEEGMFICAGFCGHGLPRAFMCGQTVGEMVAGQKPKYIVDRYIPDLRRGWSADLRAGHAVTQGATKKSTALNPD